MTTTTAPNTTNNNTSALVNAIPTLTGDKRTDAINKATDTITRAMTSDPDNMAGHLALTVGLIEAVGGERHHNAVIAEHDEHLAEIKAMRDEAKHNATIARRITRRIAVAAVLNGASQTDVASALGITQAEVSHLRAGERVKAAAKAGGVKVSDADADRLGRGPAPARKEAIAALTSGKSVAEVKSSPSGQSVTVDMVKASSALVKMVRGNLTLTPEDGDNLALVLSDLATVTSAVEELAAGVAAQS